MQKIKITKTKTGFSADFLDLPGMPPVGFGKTKRHAILSLFQHLIYDKTYLKMIRPAEEIQLVEDK